MGEKSGKRRDGGKWDLLGQVQMRISTSLFIAKTLTWTLES
jgi:hypothetical protein